MEAVRTTHVIARLVKQVVAISGQPVFVGTSLRLPQSLRSYAITVEVDGLYRSTDLVIARRTKSDVAIRTL